MVTHYHPNLCFFGPETRPTLKYTLHTWKPYPSPEDTWLCSDPLAASKKGGLIELNFTSLPGKGISSQAQKPRGKAPSQAPSRPQGRRGAQEAPQRSPGAPNPPAPAPSPFPSRWVPRPPPGALPPAPPVPLTRPPGGSRTAGPGHRFQGEGSPEQPFARGPGGEAGSRSGGPGRKGLVPTATTETTGSPPLAGARHGGRRGRDQRSPAGR